MRSYEDLDARNGMNRAPRSSRDLTARSFENQLFLDCTCILERVVMMQRDVMEYRYRTLLKMVGV